MSLRAKVSEHLLSKARALPGQGGKKYEATMRHDRFNEKGGMGEDFTELPERENPEAYTPEEGVMRFSKKYRKFIKSKKEHNSARLGKHSAKHPGFASVQNKIAREGYSHKIAGAILAHATRSASKAAHKANPRLNRVKG